MSNLNDNDPYSNRDPYANTNNVTSQIQAQNRLLNKQEEQAKKRDSEQAFDRIVSSFLESINLGINFKIKNEDKFKITRFHNEYFFKYFFLVSFLVFFLSIFFSFFSFKIESFSIEPFYSSFLIFAEACIFYIYSKNNFIKTNIRIHNLKEEDIIFLKHKIFNDNNDFFSLKIVFCLLIFLLFLLNAIVYFNSQIIFLSEFPQLLKFLSNFSNFNAKNELFAISNSFSIFIFILLKIYDRLR